MIKNLIGAKDAFPTDTRDKQKQQKLLPLFNTETCFFLHQMCFQTKWADRFYSRKCIQTFCGFNLCGVKFLNRALRKA